MEEIIKTSKTRVPFQCRLYGAESEGKKSELNHQAWSLWREDLQRSGLDANSWSSRDTDHPDLQPISVKKVGVSCPKCHLCHQKTEEIHWFYWRCCPECGDASFLFREAWRDFCAPQRTANLLNGKRALVTGGRIKLGYQVALSLLRLGAEVVVTSRPRHFPRSPEDKFVFSGFLSEPDVAEWKERLHCVPLDLAVSESIKELVEVRLMEIWPDGHLDIVIQNAAQTIRVKESSSEHGGVISMNTDKMPWVPSHWFSRSDEAKTPAPVSSEIRNTWMTPFGEIDPEEIQEVFQTNVIGTINLNQRLLSWLRVSSKGKDSRYLIHVHASEGRFDRHKTHCHLHTNAAKAAVAMMTRCLAGHDVVEQHLRLLLQLWPDLFDLPWCPLKLRAFVLQNEQMLRVYRSMAPLKWQETHENDPFRVPRMAKRVHFSASEAFDPGLQVHGVDPGFISVDEYPASVRWERGLGVPPLDEFEGAARVIFPILMGFRSFGGTWKNYLPLESF